MFKKFAENDRTGNGFIRHHRLNEITDQDYDQIMKISVHTYDGFDISQITNKLPNNLTFTLFGTMGGEITQQIYNKATAIQTIKQYYGKDMKTLAIGDSDNDITMLKEADFSVAMKNGSDSVKEIADYTTTEIDCDGLLNAFKHYDLI